MTPIRTPWNKSTKSHNPAIHLLHFFYGTWYLHVDYGLNLFWMWIYAIFGYHISQKLSSHDTEHAL